MQIDLTSKVCRQDSVFQHLKDLNHKGMSKERMIEEMKGMTVVTSYSKGGKHTYQIEAVDFDKTPKDEFKLKNEKTISFMDYYKTQYQIRIKDQNQPLLVVKDAKTGNQIYLIPELCEMTGLTDSHRADFRLMKDLGAIMHKSPRDK